MNSSTVASQDPVNVFTSLLMILIGAAGIVFNMLIVYIFAKSSAERTSFNLICVFRGVGNSIILVWAFLATFVPITLLGDSTFSPYYQTLVIGIVNSVYAGLQQTSVLIAVNRFFSLFFPRAYSKLFSIWGTLIVLLIILAVKTYSIIKQLIYFLPLECFMTYTVKYLCWIPSRDPKCDEDTSSDWAISSTTTWLVFIIVVNVATFAKIFYFYKSTSLEKERVDKKIRKNQILFVQTFIQDSLNLIDILFTFKLSALSYERYWTFISSTLVWEVVHALDGFIMIMFNERLTFLKQSFFPSTANASRNMNVSVSNSPPRNVRTTVKVTPIQS